MGGSGGGTLDIEGSAAPADAPVLASSTPVFQDGTCRRQGSGPRLVNPVEVYRPDLRESSDAGGAPSFTTLGAMPDATV